MRLFRSVRLLVPFLVLPLVFSAVVSSGPASASANKTVKCVTITGTYGGSWSLNCQQEAITGGLGTVAQAFPTSPSTIQWGTRPDPRIAPDQTTIQFSIGTRMGHRNKCRSGSSEFVLTGSVSGNTSSPGIKGRVKAFVCISPHGALSLVGSGGMHPKPFKI